MVHGLTPSLVSGVWVGGEDRSIHFDGMGTGREPAWHYPYTGYICKRYMEIRSWVILRTRILMIPPEYADPCSGGGMDDKYEEYEPQGYRGNIRIDIALMY